MFTQWAASASASFIRVRFFSTVHRLYMASALTRYFVKDADAEADADQCKRTLIRLVQSWASYQIRKIAGCACAGNSGNVFPRRRFQRKPLVSNPGMHHGTCVMHVPWCMSGSLTRGDGEKVRGIPGACTPAILRIWQEAHGGARAILASRMGESNRA